MLPVWQLDMYYAPVESAARRLNATTDQFARLPHKIDTTSPRVAADDINDLPLRQS
jgi:hypothetical protein